MNKNEVNTNEIIDFGDNRFDEVIRSPLSSYASSPGFKSYFKDTIQRKYFGEQSKWHPCELVWPGYNGLPVIGSYFHIKNEEASKVIPVKYFYCKIFDLSEKEDYEHYNWVMDRISSGWFYLIFIDRKWAIDEKNNKNKIIVYLEWLQYYSKFPI